MQTVAIAIPVLPYGCQALLLGTIYLLDFVWMNGSQKHVVTLWTCSVRLC
jgi:hypothetical protein